MPASSRAARIAYVGALVALLAWFIWTYGVTFAGRLDGCPDTTRDLLRVHALVHYGVLPDYGPGVFPTNVSLGPGYYYVAALAQAIAPGPLSVHWLHVVTSALGLLALADVLRRLSSRTLAVALTAILVSGTYFERIFVPVWHNGLMPGLVMAWFWLVWGGLQRITPPARGWTLVCAWLVQTLMLHTHASAAPFAVALGLTQIVHWWRDGWRAAPGAEGLAAAVSAWLTIDHVLLLASLDTQTLPPLGSSEAHRVDLLGTLRGVVELLSINDGASGPSAVTGTLVLFAALGALRRGRSAFRDHGAYTVVVAAMLAACVATATIFNAWCFDARYMTGLVIVTVLVMGIGLHDAVAWLQRRARSRPRVAASIAVSAIVAWGLLASLGPHAPDESEASDAGDQGHHHHLPGSLVLLQPLQSAFSVLAESRPWSATDLLTRVHGPVFSSNFPVRYWSRSLGFRGDGAPGIHLAIFPPEFPRPATTRLERLFAVPQDDTSSLEVLSFRPRLDYAAIQARSRGRHCPVTLPYLRARYATALDAVGLAAPPEPEACGPPGEPLTLHLPRVEGDAPLTLIASFDNPEPKGSPDQMFDIRVAATDASGRPVPVLRLPHDSFYVVYSIDVTRQPLVVTVSPVVPLGHLDIY